MNLCPFPFLARLLPPFCLTLGVLASGQAGAAPSPAAPAAPGTSSEPLRLMLLTGQMNKHHSWELTSDLVEKPLLASGRFTVDRVLSPPQGADMSVFRPNFAAYHAIVIIYDGDRWAPATEAAFVDYMRAGGGLVTVHSTDNAFADWPEWNEMIGLGGWGGRNEQAGPLVRWRDGRLILETGVGGATHPPQHDFLLTVRDYHHPITQGLPETWLHAHDECYSRLRGPARSLTVLATGYADPALKNATGEHEPMLMAIHYGAGRVFHTTLGHVGVKEQLPVRCAQSVDFITTLVRGAEWAASGHVTLPVLPDFPTPYTTSLRP